MTPAATLAKQQAAAKRDALELALLQQLKALGLDGGLVRQHRFHGERQWRFDFAYPALKLAIEVDGGTWTNGAHSRGSGISRDNEKLAAAVILGWRVMRATTNQVKDGTAAYWVEQALAREAVPARSARHYSARRQCAASQAPASSLRCASVRRLFCPRTRRRRASSRCATASARSRSTSTSAARR
jgi:very-short-patch-repair endonuclease